MMMMRSIGLGIAGIVLAGCTPYVPPPLTADHPASPAAAVAPLPAPPDALRTGAPAPDPWRQPETPNTHRTEEAP